LFSTEAGLFFFKFDLSLTSFLFTLTVLLLFSIVTSLLVLYGDRLGTDIPGNISFFSLGDWSTFVLGIVLSDSLLSN
jgi:hypothetical protein